MPPPNLLLRVPLHAVVHGPALDLGGGKLQGVDEKRLLEEEQVLLAHPEAVVIGEGGAEAGGNRAHNAGAVPRVGAWNRACLMGQVASEAVRVENMKTSL